MCATNTVAAYTKKMPGDFFIIHSAEVAEETAIFTQGAIRNEDDFSLNVNLTNIVNTEVTSSILNLGSSYRFSKFYFSVSSMATSVATDYFSSSTYSTEFQLLTNYIELLYHLEPDQNTIQSLVSYKKIKLSLGAEQQAESSITVFNEIDFELANQYYFVYRAKYFENRKDQNYSVHRVSQRKYLPDFTASYDKQYKNVGVKLNKSQRVNRFRVSVNAAYWYTEEIEAFYNIHVVHPIREGWTTFSDIGWGSDVYLKYGLQVDL